MADDAKWDRRDEDRRARADFAKQIKELRGELRAGLDKMAERIDELDDYLRGGKGDTDPLGTRVHLLERAVAKLDAMVVGGPMGQGSLKELAKQASKDATEALKIAEGRSTAQVTRRGQNFTPGAAAISLVGTLTMAVMSNWHRIRGENPTQKLERIQREIEEEKKTRGPEIQKKLREIERAARYR